MQLHRALYILSLPFSLLIKQLTEAVMQAELEEHIVTEESPNRKNGSTSKTIKSPVGEFELKTVRDRASTFEPQIVKKHQTHRRGGT